MANPYATYLERFLANTGHAAAPTLEDAISYIRSGATQAEKGRPEMLTAGHKAAREGLNNVFMVDIGGGKLINLAPNAPRIHVKTEDGRVLQFPKSARAEAEKAGTVMNFTPKQLEEALPPAPPPAPTKDTNAAVAAAIEQASKGVQAERTAAQTAAQQEAEAARSAAARQAEIDKANAWKTAGSDEAARIQRIQAQEARAREAGAGTDTVDLRDLLGEGKSPIPPAVQLAKDTASAPRAVPISEAAPTAAEVPASAMPWGAAPSGSKNLTPGSRIVPPTAAEEALRAADADRRTVAAVQLGIATPFAVAAGSKAITPERIDRFRTWMNTPEGALEQARGQDAMYANPQEGIERALQITRQREEAQAKRYQGMETVDDADEAEKQRYLNLQGAYGREGENTMLNPETNAWLAAPRPGAVPAISNPLDREENIRFSNIPGGAATRPASAPSTTPVTRNNAPPGTSRNDLRSIPQPTRRLGADAPTTDQGNQSFFSSIMDRLRPQDPYAGMSARQMYERAQEMQSSGDESGANLLIQRAGQAPDAGMNRGGTAKPAGPHKDAALHKALDIIHAMMTRGR